MNIQRKMIAVAVLTILTAACSSEKKPPVDLNKTSEIIEVKYTNLYKNKTIPVKLNGVSMDMIFDTGCTGLSLSDHEVLTMLKNGQISNDDVIGSTPVIIADGSMVENLVVTIRDVTICSDNGDKEIHIPNVRATVVRNQEAPVLLGNGVLDEVASYEIDNINKVIRFKTH